MFKTFSGIVNKPSEGRPMSDRIERGSYEIMDESNPGTILRSKNWEDVIQPDMMISMNMLLRKGKGWGPETADCPSCGEVYKGYPQSNELERVRW